MNRTTDQTRPIASRLLSKKSFSLWLSTWLFLAGMFFGQSVSPPASTSSAGPIQVVPVSFPTSTYKKRPIEQIALGDRVLAGNPEGARQEAEVDPATWRRVDLVMNSDGVVVDIALLRSAGWFRQCGAVVGATIPLSISELGLDGPAQVVSIEPCPTLKPGSGRVVTGTFSHDSSGVMDLKVDGRPDPIGVTQGHLVYSLDHHAFVPVGDLAVGESLSPLSGGGRVTSLSRRPGMHRVFNLEVNVEHVYHVTELGLLVHNGCPKPSPIGEGGGGGAPKGVGGQLSSLKGNIPDGKKWIKNGGRITYHSDGSITYMKNGISIKYNSAGYPDFSGYLYGGKDGLGQVRIKLTGSRTADETAANAAAGFKSTPDGYIWHHHEDTGLMQLVQEDVHGGWWHSGGFSLNK